MNKESKEILKILSDYLIEHSEIRFGQALANLGIIKYDNKIPCYVDDPFDYTDKEILDNVHNSKVYQEILNKKDYMYNEKCVIIFNKELISGIQKGKLVTQGCHCLTELTLKYNNDLKFKYFGLLEPNPEIIKIQNNIKLFENWYNNNQVKITLACPTTEEFEKLYKEMCKKFYYCKGVTDAGLTGNHGQVMWCFACIGKSEEIEVFTKDLKLL